MQPTSSTWKTLAATTGTYVEPKLIINNVEYTGIEPPIITRALMQNGLSVGNVVSAMCSFTLDTANTIPKSAEVKVLTRLVGGTEDEPVYSEWIPQGTFYVSKRLRDPVTRLQRFECYDALLKSNAVLDEVPWTLEDGTFMRNEAGEILMFSSVFPRDMKSLLQDILYLLHMTLDPRTVIKDDPQYKVDGLTEVATVRDALGMIAQAHGGNWIMSPDNKLRLVPVADVADIDTADNVIDIEAVVGDYYIGKSDVVTGIRVAMEGAPAMIGDETGLVVDVSVAGVIAAELQETLIGLEYVPFTFGSAFYDISCELGDYVRFDDIESVLNSEVVTLGHTMHGDIASPDASEMSDEYPYVGLNKSTLVLSKAYTREATEKIDKTLTQEEIFNRLTDNGAAQGLVLYDGQLYVNASYIQSGTLVLGGLNNQNGTLRVLNAKGQQIGVWDNSGIHINEGNITGGTINGAMLTLGGNNNANGTLTVKDVNGNTIGTWNSTGIIAKTLTASEYIKINGSNESLIVIPNLGATFTGIGHSALSQTGGKFLDSNGACVYISALIPTNSTQAKSFSGGAHANGILCLNQELMTVASGGYYYTNITCDKIEIYDSRDGYGTNAHKVIIDGTQIFTRGDLTVRGTKNRVVTTDQYSDRLLYCYETPSPLFGDVGEGVIGEDGYCYVTLDAVFAQTITTDQYQVFLQKYSSGDCWVKDRKGGYFIIEGTPGLAFGWEIKAKQADYDQLRLERNDEKFTVPTQTYGEDAAKHIDEIRKEREAA